MSDPKPIGTVVAPAAGGGVWINIGATTQMPTGLFENQAAFCAALTEAIETAEAIMATANGMDEKAKDAEKRDARVGDVWRYKSTSETYDVRVTSDACGDDPRLYAGEVIAGARKGHTATRWGIGYGADAYGHGWTLVSRAAPEAPSEEFTDEERRALLRELKVGSGVYLAGEEATVYAAAIRCDDTMSEPGCLKGSAAGLDAVLRLRRSKAAAQLGEMLPNGFAVGTTLSAYGVKGTICRAPSGTDLETGAWLTVEGSPPQWCPAYDVRRLPPPTESISGGASVPGKTAHAAAAVEAFKRAQDIYDGKGVPLSTAGSPAAVAKPSAPLCPTPNCGTTLRPGSQPDTAHLLRCSRCSWCGTAERLAEARKPDPGNEIGAFLCPTRCTFRKSAEQRGGGDGYAHFDPHTRTHRCACGWSGGPLLAAAKREATKPKMRFKVGDRVMFAEGQAIAKCQVMAINGHLYDVVESICGRERHHAIAESDLSPLPEGT